MKANMRYTKSEKRKKKNGKIITKKIRKICILKENEKMMKKFCLSFKKNSSDFR